MSDWRIAEAAFRELELIEERLKKPQPHLLRICARSLVSTFDTITYALKRMAAKAAAAKDVTVSPRERDVLFEYSDPPYPGAPPRRIETSGREALNVAIVVYARARASVAPLERSPLGDPTLPSTFSEATAIADRITHPEQLSDLEISKADVAVLQKTLKWAWSLRKWLNFEYLREIEEFREAIKMSFDEARQKLMQPR